MREEEDEEFGLEAEATMEVKANERMRREAIEQKV